MRRGTPRLYDRMLVVMCDSLRAEVHRFTKPILIAKFIGTVYKKGSVVITEPWSFNAVGSFLG